MTNAELFKKIFGIYAEEFWAYPKEEMLDWLNSNLPDTNAEDLISRRATIDALESLNCFGWVDDSWGKVYGIIERIPPAPSEQKWTPVSEGLPKDYVDVLVTDDSGGLATIGIDCVFTKVASKEREWLTSQRVTAWMPAPAPYKEKINDKG